MEEQKLIDALKSFKTGLNDTANLVGKIDASSIKHLLLMYEVGLGMMIDKIQQEGIKHVDEP